MNIEDYESLPDSVSTQTHMLAGCCAGIMEHAVMYPVDCVKTRLQCILPPSSIQYQNLMDGMRKIIKYEGFARSFCGIGAVVAGAGPAHALYFGLYEHLKQMLSYPNAKSNHISHAISGACATLLHDAVMTPADAIKQRLQMFNSPYHSSFDCLKQVAHAEGIGVLYRAYFTQLSSNIPFQCIHFVMYESFQNTLNPKREYLPWTHIVCGGLAGSLAAALTTPMDVCKTVLNIQPQTLQKSVAPVPNMPSPSSDKSKPKLIRGLFSAFQFVIKTQGPQGLLLGLSARVIATLPGTAISWSVYEYFKCFFANSHSTTISYEPHPGIPSTVTMESSSDSHHSEESFSSIKGC